MDLFRKSQGVVSFELTCADITGFLLTSAEKEIILYNIIRTDALTLRADVVNSDFKRLSYIAQKLNASVRVTKRKGIYWDIKCLLKRPILLAGILAVCAVAMWLPTCILFVRVEGNTKIPDRMITEQAERCGIGFASPRRLVRSEKMKNALISAIPELEWAGINTYGCLAVISVKERPSQDLPADRPGVNSIVAARDGIIHSCTATNGNLLCKAGQAVKAGEVLISGYTDCGLTIRATRADGEILAETMREITVLIPTNYTMRGNEEKQTRKFCLLLGKKRINLYKGSGISDSTCDKMYQEYYLTLPGGFQLPVALGVERIAAYDQDSAAVASQDTQNVAEEFAEYYLLEQMISGQVLSRDLRFLQEDGAGKLRGVFQCLEMIGRVQCEEIIGNYGKND